MNWYFEALKKYAVFSGRSRRKEYWYFFLFNLIITLILGLAEVFAGIAPETDQSVLAALYQLAVLLPSIAVGVRRLHDTDRSGWWLLIGLIPIVGVIVLIVFFVQDSSANGNRFGENPKEAAA
ncbi:DUF805 domain-containing protein [Luminiphilus syltensis]|uniref:DUF805 domain-containing protein n=1 Tax=Luminiphilus syltensis TaxID=1341119 RepID=UPI00059083D1|nr:DUF805 domain-containing protein [Luminiphilus syltensis]